MPYCKQWRKAMFPDYCQQGAYVDYKGIKDILHRMKSETGNHATPDNLFTELLKQKENSYKWCATKVNELTTMARAVEKCSRRFADTGDETAAAALSPEEPAPIEDFDPRDAMPAEFAKLAADSILYELLRFHECRNLNTDTIEHIIRRQFRYTPLQPTGRWVELQKEHDFMSIPIDEIFYLLSVVYERVKVEQEGRNKEASKRPAGAVGSQTFDRRSVKYWAHKQDLPFIIARVIQHLPVSFVKGAEKVYDEYVKAGRSYCLGQRISSVYFDNSNFLFYHRRLERLEGCSLIRFRWYTDTLEDDINKLTPTSDVFVEMKVHHEAWSGERSTKKRFAVKEKDVDTFLHGHLNLEPVINKLKGKGATDKEVNKFRALATDILGKVKSYDMQPVIRTQCVRAAFQRGEDQSVRVSIDSDLSMSSEDFGLAGHWRTEGPPLGRTEFPYAVVEVKLQCAENERLAPWIEELLKCRHMESVPKFSKYAHGIAVLFGHTNRIRRVPYWVHQVTADIRAAYKPEDDSWDPTVGLAKTPMERLVDRLLFDVAPPQTTTVGASEAKFLPRTDYGKIYQQLRRSGKKENKERGRDGDPNASITTSPSSPNNSTIRELASKTYDIERRHQAFLVMIKSTSAESICFPGYGTDTKKLIGGIPWQTGKRVKVPQKFDPKTLLTSERYMLKWVQKATVLGLGGLGCIRFGNGHNLVTSHSALRTNGKSLMPFYYFSDLHIYLGTTMCMMSVLICVYALLMLHARSRRVYGRKKIRFDDVRGPSILSFVIIACFLAMALNRVMLRYGPMLSGSDDI